jgi:hypothetical protein
VPRVVSCNGWTPRVSRIRRGLSVILLVVLWVPAAPVGATGPDDIVGSAECAECHKSEVRAWKGSAHYKTFAELPRREKAQEISQKLGIKRLKSESDCLTCHFTSTDVDGQVKAVEGVSCEACHGPALHWVKIHGDFGGKQVTKEEETAEHRAQRISTSESNGMLRPEQIYAVAQNCLRCHTVPNERLVNVGGHPAGSNFELVSWSQGEVRHNYLGSGGETNEPAGPERTRMLFVVGRGLDLEYSLRGVAQATEKADYAVAMAQRAKRAMGRLELIQKAQALEAVAEMLEVAQSVQLKLNNEAALLAAADKVSAINRSFAESHDGSGLAALDPLIPAKVQGTAAP